MRKQNNQSMQTQYVNNISNMSQQANNNREFLRLYNAKNYQGYIVQFQQPKEIGNFCYNSKREFVFGDSEMRYYYPADLRYPSLSKGFEKYIDRDTSKSENLDGLLNFLIHSKHPEFYFGVNFVLYRGVMTKILTAPYQNKDALKLRIIKYNGIIYINDIKVKEEELSEQMKKFCFYGYKFETLSTLPKIAQTEEELNNLLKERLEEIVDNHIELASVFKTKLGEHSLLMGAEVDCVSTESNNKSYIELKTSRIIENERQAFTFERYKLLKFWTQSFLAGIPKVVVGFRDDMGNLKSIETFNTLEIPRKVRGSNSEWDPNVCLHFGKIFLDWIKKNVIYDDINISYIITYDPNSKTFNIQKDKEPTNFLTNSYLESSNVYYKK